MIEKKEARYYRKVNKEEVQCLICPHACLIKEGASGKCRSRINHKGILYAENYGNTISLSIDPIEKKPLYHYYPGSEILSLGPNSCNLSCSFCQNYEISQFEVNTMHISPEQLRDKVLSTKARQVAFTYTEPVMWFEYIMDCAPLFKEAGIRIVMVSNGFINPEPLKELLPVVGAWNIDLKSMDDEFYEEICGAHVAPVLKTIEMIEGSCGSADATPYEAKAHLEITNLLIPGKNVSPAQIQTLVDWVAELNPEIPLHFSRYFPRFRMTEAPTPEETLDRSYRIATQKLHYVYIGNVAHHESFNTYCFNCKSLLLERKGYATRNAGLDGDKCRKCGTKLYGKF